MFHFPLLRGGVAAAVLFTAFLSGCADKPQQNQPQDTPKASHEHAEKGPHGGMLIELGGNHEFHAELLHDEATGLVTVYLLDGKAANPVAISDPQITINVRLPEGGEQFALEADPNEGDPNGVSSRFVSRDPKLGEALHHEKAQSQLVLNIDGKPFRGTIEHHHDHDHDHDHDLGHSHGKSKQPSAPAGDPS